MQTARPQDTGGARTALPAALPDARHLVKIGHMRYVMSNKWSLTEHFVITDGAGNPCFDVRGNLTTVSSKKLPSFWPRFAASRTVSA